MLKNQRLKRVNLIQDKTLRWLLYKEKNAYFCFLFLAFFLHNSKIFRNFATVNPCDGQVCFALRPLMWDGAPTDVC